MNKKMLGALGALMMVSACAHHATTCENFKQVFKQEQVLFSSNRAELDAESKAVLDHQADWLKKNLRRKVVIQGYADPRGTEAHNMNLGMKRADAVKAYLVKSGVNPDQIAVTSKGATELATTQNTAQGWTADRRALTLIVTE